MDFTSGVLTKRKFQTGMRFSCKQNLPEAKWTNVYCACAFEIHCGYEFHIGHWNFILGDKISCKHSLKWNIYAFPSKHRVVLNCSRNETSCEQNFFSHRFEFILPLLWTHCYFFMNGKCLSGRLKLRQKISYILSPRLTIA